MLFSLNDVAIVEKIKDTRAPFYRPPLPQQESEGVHPGILTLMKQCWDEDPSERPLFDEVVKSLKNVNKGKSEYVVVFFFFPPSSPLFFILLFLLIFLLFSQ